MLAGFFREVDSKGTIKEKKERTILENVEGRVSFLQIHLEC
jgi:hypothetical protein